MRIPLAGAIVLVTGGASGIGKEMAIGATHRGAKHVIIWDIDEDGGEAVVRKIESFGGHVSFYHVNLLDPGAITSTGEQVLADLGRVDVLINSAGIVTGKHFLDLTDDDVTRTFGLNTFALYRTTRIFLPGMLERGKGSVVTIASAAGLVGVARQTDYSASKFAATGFNESLRAELHHSGHDLHTLIVQPYYINTGMFDGVETKYSSLLPILETDEVAAKVLDAIEAGRQSLVLPPFAALIKLLKILPVPLHDKLCDLFGINSTMDDFTGRKRN